MQEKWWASSAGTGDLSLTLKGLILVNIPYIIWIARIVFGTDIPEDGLVAIADAVASVVALGTGLLSALMVLVGLLRKAVNWFRR